METDLQQGDREALSLLSCMAPRSNATAMANPGVILEAALVATGRIWESHETCARWCPCPALASGEWGVHPGHILDFLLSSKTGHKVRWGSISLRKAVLFRVRSGRVLKAANTSAAGWWSLVLLCCARCCALQHVTLACLVYNRHLKTASTSWHSRKIIIYWVIAAC